MMISSSVSALSLNSSSGPGKLFSSSDSTLSELSASTFIALTVRFMSDKSNGVADSSHSTWASNFGQIKLIVKNLLYKCSFHAS